MLAFHAPRDFLKSALTDAEKAWIDACDAVKPEALRPEHRHNLPDWLAGWTESTKIGSPTLDASRAV